MARIACYVSPARGHLYPTMPVLLELARRGHEITVATLASEVEHVTRAGLRARPIAKGIEDLALDDHGASSPLGALDRAMRTFVRRAPHEVEDVAALVRDTGAEALLVDFNTWGATAFAEASGLPWAMFMPYFLPWRLPGLPPFGPGFAPRADLLGRTRDAIVGGLVSRVMDRHLGTLNAVRATASAPPLAHLVDHGRGAPCVLYYTSEPFEYPCAARPSSVVQVGPLGWEPGAKESTWTPPSPRPVVLVTCSTEYQADAAIVQTALEALASEDVTVVATTAAIDPSTFAPPPNATVARFVPHAAVLAHAACVVCHGGMGITQKSLAAGVPVCVVPFGRDQLEVAARVERAQAGVRLAPGRLRPDRLRDAVRAARACRPGAERIAAAFRDAGGASRAADAFEAVASGHSHGAGLPT